MNYVLLRCFLMTTFQSGRRPAWNRCVMTGWRPWTLTHLLDGALCHFITPDKITTSAILKPSTAISNSLQQRITMDMHEVLRSYSFVCQICLTRGEEKKAISHGDVLCERLLTNTLQFDPILYLHLFQYDLRAPDKSLHHGLIIGSDQWPPRCEHVFLDLQSLIIGWSRDRRMVKTPYRLNALFLAGLWGEKNKTNI